MTRNMMTRKAKRPAATAAVDKQCARSRMSTTPATAPAPPGGSRGTRRLTKRELRSIIALKPEPFPEDDYLDGLAGSFPPEWIEQKKREHAEDAAYFGKMDEEYEAFRKKVISGVKEKGYSEVDVSFLAGEGRTKGYVSKRFASMDSNEISRRFSTREQELGDGYYNAHVRDEEDALVSDGDDADSQEGDDDGAGPTDEDALLVFRRRNSGVCIWRRLDMMDEQQGITHGCAVMCFRVMVASR